MFQETESNHIFKITPIKKQKTEPIVPHLSHVRTGNPPPWQASKKPPPATPQFKLPLSIKINSLVLPLQTHKFRILCL